MGKRILAAVFFLAVSPFVFGDVVIDDFNDLYASQTTVGNRLGLLAHSGYYYGFTDSTDGGNSKMVPDVVLDKTFGTAVVALGRDQSNCIHIVSTLGSGFANPYTAFGFNIKNEGEYVDLTAMTSLTLWAKGSGTVRVKFQTYKVTSGFPAGKNWGDMGTDLLLTADWKKYTITPATIVPQPYSPQADAKVTWDSCKTKVGKIIFQTGPNMKAAGVLDLSLDDIIMQGVTPATFGGTWDESAGIYNGKSEHAPSAQTFSIRNEITSPKFSIYSQGSYFDFSGKRVP
jgi:hypothetical protein